MKTLQCVILVLVGITLITTASAAQKRAATIEFTLVPGVGEGSNSQGDISGKVKGLARPGGYKIVIYAHTDQWYVQPLANDPYTDIAADGTWSNWTHLGRRYAVLVVHPAYRPSAKIQVLPKVGGDVIARAEVAARGQRGGAH
jgi:hypothetical protein